ncbi:hypothetical protein O181_063238 [Austropuccinia psidii MF-1]|uniref:Phosphoglycerate mutase n=1 Tax=Austropuccinia psidii MF-1 TaxID=1389203 RepID=A0A9Q3I0E3_9BASI|nr:hypothetical protein [Austropuccinia psidii MF-1]
MCAAAAARDRKSPAQRAARFLTRPKSEIGLVESRHRHHVTRLSVQPNPTAKSATEYRPACTLAQSVTIPDSRFIDVAWTNMMYNNRWRIGLIFSAGLWGRHELSMSMSSARAGTLTSTGCADGELPGRGRTLRVRRKGIRAIDLLQDLSIQPGWADDQGTSCRRVADTILKNLQAYLQKYPKRSIHGISSSNPIHQSTFVVIAHRQTINGLIALSRSSQPSESLGVNAGTMTKQRGCNTLRSSPLLYRAQEGWE